MKKTLTWALILLTTILQAQIHFRTDERAFLCIVADPGSFIKEKSPNIGVDVGCNIKWVYIRTGIQTFFVLPGHYWDWTTALGINLTTGRYERWNAYTGARMGVIYRDFNPYPTVGVEAGINYVFDNGFLIGAELNDDLRTDWEYWGGESGMRISGKVKVGWKL